MGGNNLPPNKMYRPIVEKALATGDWIIDGSDASGHGIIRHLGSGRTCGYAVGAATHGELHGPRNFAKDILQISGHNVWERGSRKQSRKAPPTTGFSIEAAKREAREAEKEAAAVAAEEELQTILADIITWTIQAGELREQAAAARAKAERTYAGEDIRRLQELTARADALSTRAREANAALLAM